MKLALLFAAVSAALSLVSAERCRKMRIRREIRDLSDSELDLVLDAIDDLYTRTINGDESVVDTMTATYLKYQDPAKGTPYFLPWMRQFLNMFENELRRYNPTLTLPYWDWSVDNECLDESEVLDKRYFGLSETRRGGDRRYSLKYPARHRLSRPDLNDFVFMDRRDVRSLINNAGIPYADFCKRLDALPGNANGRNRGVDAKDFLTSNDPLFLLAMANVDRIWAEWQLTQAAAGNGREEFGGYYKGQWASLDDIMEPFRVRVAEVIRSDRDLCYVYEEPKNARRPRCRDARAYALDVEPSATSERDLFVQAAAEPEAHDFLQAIKRHLGRANELQTSGALGIRPSVLMAGAILLMLAL